MQAMHAHWRLWCSVDSLCYKLWTSWVQAILVRLSLVENKSFTQDVVKRPVSKV